VVSVQLMCGLCGDRTAAPPSVSAGIMEMAHPRQDKTGCKRSFRGRVGGLATTVLLVEDERKLRELVRSYLERAGFTVLSTDSGAEALTMAASADPDLVVLDLGLPDVPGDAVAREMRADRSVPILMLTARVAEEDRIAGLQLGADDYVTKPFSPRELVLRVQAILRRGGSAKPRDTVSYGAGLLVIDEPRRQVTVRGAGVELTPTEWGILVALAAVPGRVYSRFELINKVRGYEFEGYERSIDSHVKNLRRKVEAEPGSPQIVQTVLGGGYRLGLARDD
jgi:DNA-binding response OmpR family regulator